VLFDVANGTETALETVGEGVTSAAWLGSETLVLGRLTSGERVQVWQIARPDGVPEPLTNDLMTYVGLDVDKLGRSLVTARREASAVVWVGDATGSSGAEVTSAYPHRTIGLAGARVAWAGTRLLYDTIASGTATIMAVPTVGGLSTEIVPDAYGFAATADGRTIVHMRGRGGLWKSDGSGRPPTPLVDGEFAANPLLTPDGQQVAFVTTRSGTQTLWVAPIDGGDAVEVAPIAVGVGAQSFDISSDGPRLLAATVNEAGDATLAVCDWPSCSNRRDFAVPTDFDAPVRWTRDGREIAFVSQRGTNIWSMPPEDGATPRPITTFSETAARRKIADYAWSPDGTRLAIVFLTTSEDVVLISGLQGE
jgi:hypothetical protein